MPGIPLTTTDAIRLAELESFDILDTPPEPGFDDVVLLASEICETPVALVSLVARDRQWFKARIGFDPCQTSLDESVCAHALESPDLLVIPDLTTDRRTRSNALVTGDPHLRFYAGAPLRTSRGEVLGTLCVMDGKPRPRGLTSTQSLALQVLARQTVLMLEARRALSKQVDARSRREAFLETQRDVSSAAGDLDSILEALVAGAMRAIAAADGGAILARDGEDVTFRATQGGLRPHVGLRYPLDGSLVGTCIRTGEAILCPDSKLDVRVDHDVAERIGFRSCVMVPVVRHGEIIGALRLQSPRPEAFTDRDLDVARLFAGTVSTGVAEAAENAALIAAQSTDARYRAVFESALEYAIVVMDLQGRITDWNVGAARVLGWSAEEVRGGPAHIFFTAEDRDAHIPEIEMRSAILDGRAADERWHLRKDGTRFWANGEMMTLRDGSGKTIGFVKILRDRTEQRNAIARLAASEASLRTIIEAMPVGILLAEAPSGRITQRNSRMDEIVGPGSGSPKVMGTYGDWLSYHADGSRVRSEEYPLARVLYENVDAASLQVNYQRRDGARVWLELAAAPVRDADGRLTAAVVVVTDIGARKTAEARQGLMNHELSHRMKNLMTMVLAVANSTMRNAIDLPAARDVLNDRLIAMSKAHEILLRGATDKSSIADVIRGGTDVHADRASRFTLTGPDLDIGPGPALALSMMVHELSTNAAKYGALSTDEGRVAVRWSIVPAEEDDDLRIEWKEVGGPHVTTPLSKGFGSRLIERGLKGHVGGTLSITYAPNGHECVTQAPLSAFQNGDDEQRV